MPDSICQDTKRERKRQLDKDMDSLRNRFGADTIVRGAAFQSAFRVRHKYRALLENKRQDTDKGGD